MDIESAIESIGSCGLWQLWTYFWIFYAVCFFSAVNLCIVFMQYIPDFVCQNSLFHLTNWTFDEIRMISTPKHSVGDEFDGCRAYNRSYESIANLSSNFSEAYSLINDSILTSSHSTLDCPLGPYDWKIGDGMHLSVVNQWNLVCEQAYKVSSTTTAYMVGFFFGDLAAMFLADRFGRKKVMMIAFSLSAIFGLIDPWIPNFYLFLAIRFAMGFTLTAGYCPCYVLCLELCPDAVRKPLGALYFISYSVGYAGLAVVAFFLRDWRVMHTVISATLLTAPLFYWLLPESPRWLVSQGRDKEAIAILEKAARWNKKKVNFTGLTAEPLYSDDEKAKTKYNTVESTKAEPTNFFVVFTYPRLALRTLNIIFNWVINTFVYYGISYLITSFSGNIFLNNAISGALETPAYLLCYPLLYWARKKSLMVMLIISGISCLMYLPVQHGPVWGQLLVAFIGKLAITASFNLIFLVTLELYPTSMRAASVAIGSMTARAGAIGAPWVVLIGQKNKALIWVPMVIYGAVALAAGVLTFFLPESQNQPLPETLDEALNYPPKRKELNRGKNNVQKTSGL